MIRLLRGFVLACGLSAAFSVAAMALQSGTPAPDFTLPYSNGGSLTLSHLRGHAVYLNFFASWCAPCSEEAVDVNRMQILYRKRGLVVVGVNELESADKANQFIASHHLTYRAIVDGGQIHGDYAGFGLPVHVFIDKRGIVKLYRAGEMSRSQIEAAVRSIL